MNLFLITGQEKIYALSVHSNISFVPYIHNTELSKILQSTISRIILLSLQISSTGLNAEQNIKKNYIYYNSILSMVNML